MLKNRKEHKEIIRAKLDWFHDFMVEMQTQRYRSYDSILSRGLNSRWNFD